MKTCFLYGFLLAVAGSILILVLYFLGFHSDPAKLAAGNWIGGVLGLGIGISLTVLGVKARRSEVPENVEFGYGRALGAGVLISLFASILSTIFNYVYAAFINPGPVSYTHLSLQEGRDDQGEDHAEDEAPDQIAEGEDPGGRHETHALFHIFGLDSGDPLGLKLSHGVLDSDFSEAWVDEGGIDVVEDGAQDRSEEGRCV